MGGFSFAFRLLFVCKFPKIPHFYNHFSAFFSNLRKNFFNFISHIINALQNHTKIFCSFLLQFQKLFVSLQPKSNKNNNMNTTAMKLIEERVKEASDKLHTFTHCAEIWRSLNEAGYTEGATAFRTYIYNLLLENPDVDEATALKDVKSYLNIQ